MALHHNTAHDGECGVSQVKSLEQVVVPPPYLPIARHSLRPHAVLLNKGPRLLHRGISRLCFSLLLLTLKANAIVNVAGRALGGAASSCVATGRAFTANASIGIAIGTSHGRRWCMVGSAGSSQGGYAK